MKLKPTQKQYIGTLGESLACKYLENKGFSIKNRNYRKFYGEIDIIAEKGSEILFVEVKSVTRENISRVTSDKQKDNYRPEDNLHPAKLKRLYKTISTYLSENRLGNREWRLDALIVYIDTASKKARIERIENILL